MAASSDIEGGKELPSWNKLGPFPTQEEFDILPRVPGRIPWTAWTVAFVEFVERFSYYGTSAVYVNLIQQPLPEGSKTGDGFLTQQSGAFNMGQRASTGITTFNQFWSYFTPLFGAYLADQYRGRYLTIQYANVAALVGHVILIISAIPPVITHPTVGIAIFTVGLFILGMGTGGFKSNISPLIAEQYTEKKAYVRTDKRGHKEIVEPAHFVGFWLSFTLPTICYLLCPLILFYFKKSYKLTPPTGSVMAKAWKLVRFACKKSKDLRDPEFWQRVKPSELAARGEPIPKWMTFDDEWVDEVKRASTMTPGSTPNDIINNLNPLFIVIIIPVTDFIVYPGLRKCGVRLSSIREITAGFVLGSMAMVSACVTQAYIYKLSKCGSDINAKVETGREDCAAPISVWVQGIPYGLIGMSEVLAAVTKLEYAYTKAPSNMKSTVQAIALATSAFSSALSQALVAPSNDPLLVWNYGVVAVLAMVGAIGFYLTFREADRDEYALNNQKQSSWACWLCWLRTSKTNVIHAACVELVL
ncbi:peptide transporter PTR2-A [Cordyceps fumosorosea ARSEF 2679]|uniref:Peptide transporter PTR2-A n=1 Tax=Cordyceps fumosorosea (strain ARSEF 2679) TaxID=1081104 RepID=A0A167SU33_CORFA|nr:peptide transporter PTR2-A [Cordyceps fumosorosea ARSEF 2679]OAA59928.1 peptide transporter PTR2-A [Cordyceps fumosorosea ARSEF 2679]